MTCIYWHAVTSAYSLFSLPALRAYVFIPFSCFC